MSDLLLDKFNDIEIIEGEAFLIADKNTYLAQVVETRMKTYYGEWYRNYTLGVPYFEAILKKGVEKSFVDAIFKAVIKETTGVNAVKSYKSSVQDGKIYLADFTFIADDGDLISITTQIEI